MSDVASLGLAVDSSGVKAATGDLKGLTAASREAEQAANSLAASNTKSETQLRAIESAARRAGISVAEFEARTARFNAATDSAAQSQQRLAASTVATGTAAATGGTSLVRMVGSYNTISLILQGINTAAAAYYTLTQTNGPALEKSLEEQARLIGLVKDAYRNATDQAGKFFQSSKEVVELQLKLNINDLQTKLRDQIGDVLKAGVGFTPDVDPMDNALGTNQLNSANLGPFQKAAEELYKSLGEGAPAIERFQKTIADLGNANPELAATAGKYLEFAKAAAESADKFRQAESALAIVQGRAVPDDRSRLGLSNPKPIRDVADAYDRATDSVRRSIAVMNADADAVGQSAGQHARLRAEAQLVEGGLRAGLTPEAVKATARYKELGDAAEAAGLKLAKAQVNDQIKEDRQTIGFSPEDLQIAQALKQVYPDITERMNSTEAAQMRLNNAMRAGNEIVSSFGNDLVGGLLRGEDAMKSLTSAASNLVQKLASKNLSNFLNGGSLFGNQELGSTQGAVGMASAGLAGYQSGNALTGALGGAMAGATFGPIGAVAGGILGAVGGIIGASEKSKKQLEEAKKAWADAAPAFDAFMRSMTGQVQGDLARSFQAALQTTTDLSQKAYAAKDFAALARIQAAYNEDRLRESKKFVTTFNATLEGLADGLGPDSPFLKAVETVKSQLASVQGFVDDARTAFNVLNGDIDGNKTPGFTPSVDQLAAVQAQVDAATSSATKFLLSLLQTTPALSAVQTGLLNIRGTAAALQGALEQLGLSSADAAEKINAGVTAAIQALAATFTDGLQREINDALGKGYLNSTADLIAKRTIALGDANSLGTGTDLVDRWFSVQAQKLIDDAELTGQAFAELVMAFPALIGAVHEFTGAAEAAAKTAEVINYQAAAQAQLSTATSELSNAQSALNSAYQDQANTLNGLISTAKGFVDQFAKLKASLKLNQSYSPLSAQEQYLLAQQAARTDAALAASGDKNAQARLADELTAYLDQSKSFNASTEAYYNDFQEVQSILTDAGAYAENQVNVAEQQLNVLNQQVGGLIAINNSVLTVAQGISNLILAQSNLAAAMANQNAQRDWGVRPLINQMIQRGLEDAGINFGGNYGPNGDFGAFVAAQTASTQAIINAIAQTVPQSLIDFYARQGFENGGIVGAFAGGGMVGNGIFGRDSVIARYAGGGNIALAGGEYVMPASQTRRNLPALQAMHSGRGAGNDNGAVVAAIDRLSGRLARIEAATLQGASHVGARVDASAGATKRASNEQRQANNAPGGYRTRKSA